MAKSKRETYAPGDRINTGARIIFPWGKPPKELPQGEQPKDIEVITDVPGVPLAVNKFKGKAAGETDMPLTRWKPPGRR